MQKYVEAVFNQCRAAGVIEHSTSPWVSPVVVVPRQDGSVRFTVHYKHLPRVGEILDSLYKGKVFSVFDLNSAFHRIVIDPGIVPLTAFFTPRQLFGWLRMPQGPNVPTS